MAKIWASKWTYVSPVWLQLRVEGGKPVVTGLHDVDPGWMDALRAPCQGGFECPLIVPRVVWEIQRCDQACMRDSIVAVVEACVGYGFDGIVLEFTQGLGFVSYLKAMADALHTVQNTKDSAPLTFIYVIGPGGGQLSAELIEELAQFVDRFSLMTYDYSSHRGVPGPEAPITWMEIVVSSLVPGSPDENDELEEAVLALRNKILLGIPFYGHDNQEAIINRQYLELLATHKPKLSWDEDAEELYFVFKDKTGKAHTVYYPSLYFLKRRLSLASDMGTGISVWELGQGLDVFMDMF